MNQGILRGWKWVGRQFAEPAFPYIALFCMAAILIGWASRLEYADPTFREGILIEAHGMLMDIFVLGILLAIINKAGERHRQVRGYKEEIADLAGIRDQVVAHRLAGLVRRLNALKAKPDTLVSCYVEGNLLDLRGADLSECVAVHCSFAEAMMEKSNLASANLTGAVLEGTKLMKANLQKCDLKLANCRGAWFQGADLRRARFYQAQMDGVSWEKADLDGADLRGAQNLEAEHLAKARNLDRCKMDNELRTKVAEHQQQLEGDPTVSA